MQTQEPNTQKRGEAPATEAATQGELVGAAQSAAAPGEQEDLRGRVELLEERLLRAKADFANLQRSSRFEQEQAIRYANADLVRSLLNVVDDFERSLAIDARSDDAIKLRDGVKLVYENMLKALRERGVEAIDPGGQPFDPAFHEALMRQPAPDCPPGTVLTVLARGYRLGDRLLRPARVVIAAEPAPADASMEA